MLYMAQKGKNKVKIVVISLISLYAIICGSLCFFQENIIFRPTVLSQDFIYKFSHPFQEICLKAEDGGIINAVLFKNDNPKGVILLYLFTGFVSLRARMLKSGSRGQTDNDETLKHNGWFMSIFLGGASGVFCLMCLT